MFSMGKTHSFPNQDVTKPSISAKLHGADDFMQMGRTLAEATTPADAIFSETSITGGWRGALRNDQAPLPAFHQPFRMTPRWTGKGWDE